MKLIKTIEITDKKFKKYVGMQLGDIKSTSADTKNFSARFGKLSSISYIKVY